MILSIKHFILAQKALTLKYISFYLNIIRQSLYPKYWLRSFVMLFYRREKFLHMQKYIKKRTLSFVKLYYICFYLYLQFTCIIIYTELIIISFEIYMITSLQIVIRPLDVRTFQ